MDFNDLKILRTYLYYDGPLIFSAEVKDCLFLVYSWRILEEGHEYVFFQTNAEKLTELENDKITLRNFFRQNAEVCFKVIYKDRKVVSQNSSNLTEIESEAYPKEDIFLEKEED